MWLRPSFLLAPLWLAPCAATSCPSGDCAAAAAESKDTEPSLLQVHHSDKRPCTADGEDAYASGSRVECCEGLEMCFGEFHPGSWSYVCKSACTLSCTSMGEDPYHTGTHVACCQGLEECHGEWEMDGHWSTRCYRKCSMGEYHPHFDTTPDYLDIAASARGVRGNEGELSDNYYLVIGDNGGCDGGCGACCGYQLQVANKMKDYVHARKAKNPRSQLLFILLVGDNFYWTGASPGRFASTWKNVYGELADYPWFVILGNHDFGNDDPECVCPFFHERIRCTAADDTKLGCGGEKPYSTANQSYSCNQLNSDKGGVDGDLRKNFHLPDFTYFYRIPELDFEIIGLDYNWYDRHGIGGNGFGPTGGGRGVAKACGGVHRMEDSLARIRDAGNKILLERAEANESTNVALISHYPDWAQEGINLRAKFLNSMHNDDKPKKRVLNFFGHTHIQQCYGHNEPGAPDLCTDLLTGGAGGCCGDTPSGFVATTWGADGKMFNECFLGPECTLWSMLLQENATRSVPHVGDEKDVCTNTVDDPRCPGYEGPLRRQRHQKQTF